MENDIKKNMQNIESLLGNKQGEETLRIIKDYLEIKEKINNEFKDYFTEVIHAKWVDTQPGYHSGYRKNAHKCSNCGDYYTTEPEDLFFCPRCGAKMDL